jgi:hypothetical protein
MAITIKFPNIGIFIKNEGAVADMVKWAAIVSIVILLFMAGLSLAADAKTIVSADDILRKIQMNEPVDYQGVIVEGNLDLSKLKVSVVSSPIKITDSQIKGSVLFNGILFKKALNFKGTEFLGKVDFSTSIFAVDSDFQDTVFIERANFANSRFDDDANFYEANFTKEGYFYGSEIKGSAIFINSKAPSMIFEKAQLKGETYIMNLDTGELNIVDTVINNPQDFNWDGGAKIKRIEPAGQGSSMESGPMASNISEIVGQRGADVHLAAIDQSEKKNESDLNLTSLVPSGPSNTITSSYNPIELFEGRTNAVDATVLNYNDKDGSTKATITIIKTLERAYVHDISVCNRYKGYNLDDIYLLPFSMNSSPLSWFWSMSASKGNFLEYDIIFTVLVNEEKKEFLIDSRWLYDNYPNPIKGEYDYVLNYQIRAYSMDESYKLLEQAINLLSEKGKVSFNNQIKPAFPSLFMKSGRYSINEIELEFDDSRKENTPIELYGSARYFDNLTKSIPFTYNITVPPEGGATDLPISLGQLDAVVFIKSNDFLDKVYVGRGFWFCYSDSQSNTALLYEACPIQKNTKQNDLIFLGCAKFAGQLSPKEGYIGVGYALNPSGMPVDITPFSAVTFFAKGNNTEYQVRLETDSVKDHDYYSFAFEAPKDGKQFTIPIASFKQGGWGEHVPFSGKDVKVISWAPAYQNYSQPTYLFIGNASFTRNS